MGKSAGGTNTFTGQKKYSIALPPTALWTLTTMLDTNKTLEYLAYLGYTFNNSHEDNQLSAINITRYYSPSFYLGDIMALQMTWDRDEVNSFIKSFTCT